MYPSESARAASASEARHRITAPITPATAARIIALDPTATALTRRLASRPWANAKFYTYQTTPQTHHNHKPAGEPPLYTLNGSPATLTDILNNADVVVIIATDDSARTPAANIGRACNTAAITTAGIILGDGSNAKNATAALRPHTRVLLPSADENDALELLTALRA
jgi:hypothetical protein